MCSRPSRWPIIITVTAPHWAAPTPVAVSGTSPKAVIWQSCACGMHASVRDVYVPDVFLDADQVTDENRLQMRKSVRDDDVPDTVITPSSSCGRAGRERTGPCHRRVELAPRLLRRAATGRWKSPPLCDSSPL